MPPDEAATASSPANASDGSGRFDRNVLRAGSILLVGLLFELAILGAMWPHHAAAMVPGLVAGLFLGREAGIPTALALGAPPLLVLQMSATLDLATGALGYGGLWALVGKSDRLGAWTKRILDERQEEAYERRGFIIRWGRWGVFLFMLVPFMVNGPLVVSLAARVAGLATRTIVVPVAAATFVGAAIWVAFSGVMLNLVGQVQGGLEIAVTAVFLGAMLAWAAWRIFSVQKRLREKRAQPTE